MISGVGLLLFAQDTKRIFVLKELKDKPFLQKKAGMLSFPLETVRTGETSKDAIKRLLIEEVGNIKVDDLTEGPVFFGGKMEILSGVAYTIPAYAFCKREFQGQPADNDIEFFGWLTLSELSKRFVRIEVEPVLKTFLVSTKN